jgi:Permeases of the drug/metabolite transporter (DMT) superfamily
MAASRSLWRGRLALLATVVIWSSPPVFQYWLAGPFDPWTQNFYRYLAGFLVIVPFFGWKLWSAPRRMPLSDWAGCAVAALPNVVHQVAQTAAVVLLLPGVYALFGRLSVVITAGLAVIFFADERWIARSGKFLLGTGLALVGVTWLVFAAGGQFRGDVRWAGLGFALLAATGWALYGILVKKFTACAGPTTGFGAVSLFTLALLWPGMLLFGDASALLRADAWTNFVLFGSGVLSIGLGHWLYYIGIREVGAAPAQSALLLCPLGTMLLSAGFFGENFRAEQLVAGAFILLGAFLALSARPPVIEEPA